MFVISCPWCGPREQLEFRCGGEAHMARPTVSAEMTDEQWADYLFMRKNPKGLHFERWNHVHGCRRWFNMARDTANDEILAVYAMGAAPPAVTASGPPTPSGEAHGSGNLAIEAGHEGASAVGAEDAS